MKIFKNGLIAGLCMLVVSTAYAFIIGFLFPSINEEYINSPALYRSWEDPIMFLFYIYPIVLGFVLAWLYGRVESSIKTEKPCKTGFNFAKFYFILLIPGMFITYTSFPVSLLMVVNWLVGAAISAFVAGIVFHKFSK